MHWRAFIQLPEGSKLPAQVINISTDGGCLLCGRSLPTNIHLDIVIGIPSANDASKVTVLNVGANVRYAVLSGEHFQIGLRFENLSDADKRRIQEAADRH